MFRVDRGMDHPPKITICISQSFQKNPMNSLFLGSSASLLFANFFSRACLFVCKNIQVQRSMVSLREFVSVKVFFKKRKNLLVCIDLFLLACICTHTLRNKYTLKQNKTRHYLLFPNTFFLILIHSL